MHRTAKTHNHWQKTTQSSWRAFIFALIIYIYLFQFSDNIDGPKKYLSLSQGLKMHINLMYVIDFRQSAPRRYHFMTVGGQQAFKEDSKLQLSITVASLSKTVASLDICCKVNNYTWIIDPIFSTIQLKFFFIIVRILNTRSTFLTNF